MKINQLWIMAMAVCTLLLSTSCSNDDDSPEVKNYKLDQINPLVNFGKTVQELQAIAVGKNGSATYDESSRILSVTQNDNPVVAKTDYYFDLEEHYQIAVSTLKDPDLVNMVLETYHAAGFKDVESDQQSKVGTVLQDPTNKYWVEVRNNYEYNHKTGTIIAAPIDEGTWSFTRRSSLSNKDGFMAPLLAVGAQPEVIKLFESRLGHTYNTTLSSPEKGIMYFNTLNDKFPYMKYWLDLDTKSYLEEAAVVAPKGTEINADDAAIFVESLGYKYVPLLDNDNAQIYWNKEMKSAVSLSVKAPEGKEKTYEPRIQFYPADYTEYLPYDKIEMIWPITEFGKYTIAEVAKLYESKDYFEDYMEADEQIGLPVVITNGRDFTKIFLFEDKGKYEGLAMLARNDNVIKSPALVQALLDAGFEAYPEAAIPTWRNNKTGVEVQIDMYDMLGMGPLVFMQHIGI